MINQFMPETESKAIKWEGEAINGIPDVTHPWLFVVDVTGSIDWLVTNIDELDYPVIRVHKIDSLSAFYSRNSMYSEKHKIRSRWIPKGYRLESSMTIVHYDYYGIILVSRKDTE